MPIENRNLIPGTRLVGRYHKQPYSCEVVEGEAGKIRFKLEDGREFKSPSAAGMAITGHACDGWVFWGLEMASDPQSLAPEQPETPDKPKPESKKTGVYRLKNQKGTPEGQVRWFCYDCGEPFHAPAEEKHPVCPNKHEK